MKKWVCAAVGMVLSIGVNIFAGTAVATVSQDSADPCNQKIASARQKLADMPPAPLNGRRYDDMVPDTNGTVMCKLLAGRQ